MLLMRLPQIHADQECSPAWSDQTALYSTPACRGWLICEDTARPPASNDRAQALQETSLGSSACCVWCILQPSMDGKPLHSQKVCRAWHTLPH